MSDDEKTCPDCAETVKAAARKCRHCGYLFVKDDPGPISESIPIPAPNRLEVFRCPSCRKPTPEKAGKCRHCGARFVPSPEVANSRPLEGKSWADRTFEGGTKTMIVCLAVPVALLGFAIYTFSGGGAENGEAAATQSSSSSSTSRVDETEIVTMCDLTVKDALATEADLDFGWKFIPRSEDEYRVVRGFKAQNGFGAVLKHTYFCTYDASTKRITKLEVEGPGGSHRII